MAVRNWGLAQKDVYNQMDIAKLQRQLADQINDYNALVNQYNALLQYTQQLRNNDQQHRNYSQHLSAQIDRERGKREETESLSKQLEDHAEYLVRVHCDPVDGLNKWVHEVLADARRQLADYYTNRAGIRAMDLGTRRKLNINMLAMALVDYEGLIEMPVRLAYAADNPQWLAQNNERTTRLLSYQLPQVARLVTGESKEACQQALAQRFDKARAERIEPALEKGDLAFEKGLPKVLLRNEQSDLAPFGGIIWGISGCSWSTSWRCTTTPSRRGRRRRPTLRKIDL